MALMLRLSILTSGSLLSVSGMRVLAGEHLVEDAAEEEDVGARVPLGAAAGPLQGRVVDGALAVGDGLFFSSPSMVARPKSTSLATPLERDQDVGRLDVAVRHALVSEYCSPRARPSMQRQGLAELQALADLEEVAEVRPLDDIPSSCSDAVLLAVVVDPDDVGVDELDARLGLLVEADDRVGVGRRTAGGGP